jgi:very-short-patch-repair endonuclease
MYGLIVPLIVVAVIVGILVAFKGLIPKGKTQALPYEKESALFSPAERSFLGALDQAIGDEFRIMGKVRLGDVVKVKAGLEKGQRQAAFNKIQSKHLDFVACDPADLSVQFVVELDDKSHERQDRQSRDMFVDEALRAAGIPIIHVPVRKSYSIQEIRDALSKALNPSNAGDGKVPAMAPAPSAASLGSAAPSLFSASPAGQVGVNIIDNQACPACGAPMIMRQASKGQNAGNTFWGCSTYPRCKKTVPILPNA